MPPEESFLECCRRRVESQYESVALGSGAAGGCFGSILCHELHSGGTSGHGLHFVALARKWGISISLLGELIADHCRRMEQVNVNHEFARPYDYFLAQWEVCRVLRNLPRR